MLLRRTWTSSQPRYPRTRYHRRSFRPYRLIGLLTVHCWPCPRTLVLRSDLTDSLIGINFANSLGDASLLKLANFKVMICFLVSSCNTSITGWELVSDFSRTAYFDGRLTYLILMFPYPARVPLTEAKQNLDEISCGCLSSCTTSR